MNLETPTELLPVETDRPVLVNDLARYLKAEEPTRVITIRMPATYHRILRAAVVRERLRDPDLSMQKVCLREIFRLLHNELRAALRPTPENPPPPFKSETPPPELLRT